MHRKSFARKFFIISKVHLAKWNLQRMGNVKFPVLSLMNARQSTTAMMRFSTQNFLGLKLSSSLLWSS